MFRWFGYPLLFCCLGLLFFSSQSCGGGSNRSVLSSTSSSGDPIQGCADCTPKQPDSHDFRHAEKHVSLPAVLPVQISVQDILSWPITPITNQSPRTGRELQLFAIPAAYIQAVWLYKGDCDMHFEISDTPDKNAPRVIVETPSDAEYCSSRQQLAAGLASAGLTIGSGKLQQVTPPIPAEVVGLAFLDFEHHRGSKHVATTWELHPAIVTLQ